MLIVDKKMLKRGCKLALKEAKQASRIAVKELAGREVRRDGDKYFITLKSGKEIEVPPAAVREVEK